MIGSKIRKTLWPIAKPSFWITLHASPRGGLDHYDDQIPYLGMHCAENVADHSNIGHASDDSLQIRWLAQRGAGPFGG